MQKVLERAFTEMSERKQAEESLRLSESRLKEAERIALLGHWELDIPQNKLHWSDEIYRIFEMPPTQEDASYEGFLNRVYPDDRDVVDKAYAESLKSKTLYSIDHRIMLRDGNVKYVHEQCENFYDSHGNAIRSIGTIQDITERKIAEEQLRKLSRAVEAAPVTIVITDRDGRIEYANPFFTKITGYDLNEVLGENPKVLKSGLTPSNLYPQLWETILNGQNWEGEFINKRKNGELYTEQARISPIFDAHGSITHFVAIKQDITQRKLAENSLSASEARYRALFDQTHDAVFILDLEGHHLMANQRAADMLGYTRDELLILSVEDTSVEISQSQNVVARLLAGEHIPLYERLFRKKNGEIFPVEINVELVKDENGKPAHIQSTVRDITERKHMEDELQRLAQTDPLTELMNRRQFFELAEKEFVRSRRYNRPLTVILLDLDLFKKVNDTYGHLAGDQALIHIGDLIRTNTRETDIVARYGGEEFILLLPETDLAGAQALADHLRCKVEETSFDYDTVTITITISIGIAGKEAHAEVASLDQVISKADKALYEAKRAGRNRVICLH